MTGTTNPTSGPGTVTLAFVGDMHAERGIRTRLRTAPQTLLAGVRSALTRADLVVANLETAVTSRGQAEPKTYNFRAPATFLPALRSNGIGVVTLANNHGMDYGQTGLRDTLAAAAAARLPLIGAGRDAAQAYAPYIATLHGQRIAVIAATEFLNPPLRQAWTATADKPGIATTFDPAPLFKSVRSAHRSGAVVVVYLHWGESYRRCPDSGQRRLEAELKRAGATVIVGSHSHLQGGGGYDGRTFVNYGLGNFLFYAGGRTDGAADSGIQIVRITAGRVSGNDWIPATIRANDLPVLTTGRARGAAIASWLRTRPCTGLTATPG